jgi:hypothetical protein
MYLLLSLSYLISLMHGHELFELIIIVFLQQLSLLEHATMLRKKVQCLSRLEFARELKQSRSLLQGHI